MEVLLLAENKIKNVKDGYGTHLISQGLAKRIDNQVLNEMKNKTNSEKFHAQENKKHAQEIVGLINGCSVALTLKAGEHGAVFGAITGKDIALKVNELLKTKMALKLGDSDSQGKKAPNFSINKNQVVLDNNIKECGIYSVPIKLYPEVTATINVEVGTN